MRIAKYKATVCLTLEYNKELDIRKFQALNKKIYQIIKEVKGFKSIITYETTFKRLLRFQIENSTDISSKLYKSKIISIYKDRLNKFLELNDEDVKLSWEIENFDYEVLKFRGKKYQDYREGKIKMVGDKMIKVKNYKNI